jgi:hypothetical protein
VRRISVDPDILARALAVVAEDLTTDRSRRN